MVLIDRAAIYADKILKGAKPDDPPIEQPTMFEFVLNLKTAKTMGVKFPQSIFIRADRVIEKPNLTGQRQLLSKHGRPQLADTARSTMQCFQGRSERFPSETGHRHSMGKHRVPKLRPGDSHFRKTSRPCRRSALRLRNREVVQQALNRQRGDLFMEGKRRLARVNDKCALQLEFTYRREQRAGRRRYAHAELPALRCSARSSMAA